MGASGSKAADSSSDVLFQDADICILRPDSKRGVLVFTRTVPAACKDGLRSYAAQGLPARRENADPDHDKLIYFRAPYRSDTSSFEASYGTSAKALSAPSEWNEEGTTIVVIRIDPEKTFVYSSDTRTWLRHEDVLKSRIPFTEYLKRIRGHAEMPPYNRKLGYPVWSNIVTYQKEYRPSARKVTDRIGSPVYRNARQHWVEGESVERDSEVVAKIPHIPPTWFVKCYVKGAEFSGGRRRKRTLRRRLKQ